MRRSGTTTPSSTPTEHFFGFGDYSFERSGGKISEWFIVGMTTRKHYIGVNVDAPDDDHYLENHVGKLGKAKVDKSSVSFDSLADINFDALLDLIEKAGQRMSQL